jgi:hypothetical protein
MKIEITSRAHGSQRSLEVWEGKEQSPKSAELWKKTEELVIDDVVEKSSSQSRMALLVPQGASSEGSEGGEEE